MHISMIVVYVGTRWLREVSMWTKKKRGPSTLGPRHRKLAAHGRFLPLRLVWIQEHDPGKRMFACRGGLVEEEEGPRHSRVWEEVEDEGRGGGRGKRWRTREEVEDEGRGGGRGKTWKSSH